MTTPEIAKALEDLTRWADPGECEWVDGPSSYCVTHDADGRWSGYGYGGDLPCKAVDPKEYAGRKALVTILTSLYQY